MKTKQLLSLVLIASLSLASAFAAGIDTSAVEGAGFADLPESQKAAIIANVAQQAEKAKDAAKAAEKVANTPPVAVVDKLGKWADVGMKIGKGISGAAKETNIAVNEFAKSPVGMLTTTLLVWNYIGNLVVHVLGALVFWAIGFTGLWIMIRRSVEIRTTTTKEGVTTVLREELSDEAKWGYTVAGFIMLLIGVTIMFTFNS